MWKSQALVVWGSGRGYWWLVTDDRRQMVDYWYLTCGFWVVTGRIFPVLNSIDRWTWTFFWFHSVDSESRRATLSLFVLVRAIDEVLRLLIKHKRIKGVKHGNIYAFTLCQIPIMVSVVLRNVSMRKHERWRRFSVVWRFLTNLRSAAIFFSRNVCFC